MECRRSESLPAIWRAVRFALSVLMERIVTIALLATMFPFVRHIFGWANSNCHTNLADLPDLCVACWQQRRSVT